ASSDNIGESSNYKSGGTYGKFEYESKKVEKEKGYYTREQSEEETTEQENMVKETTGQEETPPSEVETNEMKIPSPAIYLTVLEEVLMPEEEEEFAIGEPKTDIDNLTEEE
ncbi:6117_t:CDS:1, partial [Acaulospora morrowiae]